MNSLSQRVKRLENHIGNYNPLLELNEFIRTGILPNHPPERRQACLDGQAVFIVMRSRVPNALTLKFLRFTPSIEAIEAAMEILGPERVEHRFGAWDGAWPDSYHGGARLERVEIGEI